MMGKETLPEVDFAQGAIHIDKGSNLIGIDGHGVGTPLFLGQILYLHTFTQL